MTEQIARAHAPLLLLGDIVSSAGTTQRFTDREAAAFLENAAVRLGVPLTPQQREAIRDRGPERAEELRKEIAVIDAEIAALSKADKVGIYVQRGDAPISRFETAACHDPMTAAGAVMALVLRFLAGQRAAFVAEMKRIGAAA